MGGSRAVLSILEREKLFRLPGFEPQTFEPVAYATRLQGISALNFEIPICLTAPHNNPFAIDILIRAENWAVQHSNGLTLRALCHFRTDEKMSRLFIERACGVVTALSLAISDINTKI